MRDKYEFKVTMPIFKAYADEDGTKYIMGLGGDTQADYDGKINPKTGKPFGFERLSAECIKDMKRQIESGAVILVPRHWDVGPKESSNVNRGIDDVEWDSILGVAVEALITPDGQLFPKFRLDPTNPKSEQLYKQITIRNKQLGLSWGGGIPEGGFHLEYDNSGMIVRVIDKINLWHFAVTTRPVNSRTLNNPLEVVAKSLDWETAARIETAMIIQEDFPDREEVEAIYKSCRGGDESEKGKPAECVDPAAQSKACDENKACDKEKTTSQEDCMELTKEQLEAINAAVQASTQVAVKSIVESMNTEKEASLKAKQQEEESARKIQEGIAAGLKAAGIDPSGKPAEKPAEVNLETLKTDLLKELGDVLKSEINKTVEPYMTGLKSGLDAGAGKPGSGNEETPVMKAFAEIKRGIKAPSDYPADVRAALMNMTEEVGQAHLKAMKEGGAV